MKNIRLMQMEQLILDRKMITLEELENVFKVSKNTVRRDISELLKGGKIKKVYGGVEAIKDSDSTLDDFSVRNSRDQDDKAKIGKVACEYIEDGDIVYIDSGTTTVHISDYLQDKKNVTIITNNIDVISKVVRMDNINLIGLGGRLNRKTLSFVSNDTVDILEKFNISKAFMSATGLTIKNGATNSLYDENEIKKVAVSLAEKVFLLIDSSKFDINTLLTYCDFNKLYCIITNKAPEEYKIYARKNNVKLVECV